MKYKFVAFASFLLLNGCANNPPPPPGSVTTTGHISGAITLASTTSGISGVLVELYEGNCFTGRVLAKAQTGGQGEYRFRHMKPGKYYIGSNHFRSSQGDKRYRGFCGPIPELKVGQRVQYDQQLQAK